VRFFLELSYGWLCLERLKSTGRLLESKGSVDGQDKLKGVSVAAQPCSSELAFPCTCYLAKLLGPCLGKAKRVGLFF